MARASTIAAGLAAVALVAIASRGEVLAVLALVAAVLLGLLMAVGPARLGTWLVFAGVLLAPMNDLRPVGGSITISDFALAGGFLLLMPTLFERHARVPFLFAVGAVGLLVTSVAASLVIPDSAGSLFLALRLIIATTFMPLAFLLWRPERPTLRALAWAYVVGQVINTAVALGEGGGRVMGATVHPNALAIDGLIATALLAYLWHEVAPKHRWLVLAAAAISVSSIVMSGSRGALVALVLVALLYPVVERSAAGALTVLAGVVFTVPALTWLAALGGEDSALARLFSDDKSVTGSDAVRREELTRGLERFLDSPVLGNGFDAELLHPHNIFLQVAVAVGVLGLASYLLLLSPFVTVLFGSSPDRRLGYVTLTYLAVGMTQPSLWDRNIWTALCLTAVAAASSQVRGPEATAAEAGEEPPTPGRTKAPRSTLRGASQD